MQEWKRSIIERPEVQALPIMTYPGLELTGLKVMDIVTNSEHQAACIESLAARYPSLAAVTMMDLSLEAEAFGAEVSFSDAEVPAVIGQLVGDLDSVRALRIPLVGEKRTGVQLRSIELLAQRIKDKPVFGGHIGPFSLAGRLLDMKNLLLAVRRQPELVHAVLEKVTEFLVTYAQAIKAAGANGLIMAEPAAGLVSPKQCDEFSSPYVRKIVSAVQDRDFMVILHNCGNTVKLVPSMLSTGAEGLHFGNAVKMTDILPQVPSGRLTCGNIEPAGAFKMGSPEEMRRRVQSLLAEMRGYSNFVLSSGCDLPPQTPLANVDAFFAALEEENGQCRGTLES
jgi:uroporphyrinogen decarboxylase